MITSKENAWFKRIRDAIREHGDEIVIEGPKAVSDAIAAGWKPIGICVEAGFSQPSRAESPTYIFSPQLLKSITDTKTSQGVIGLFERPKWTADQVLARRDAIVVGLGGVR